MAKVNFYALYDNVGKLFDPPFLSHNDGLACRAVIFNCKDQNGMIFMRKNDLVLFRVGEFEDVEGVVKGVEPTKIINVGDLLSSQG